MNSYHTFTVIFTLISLYSLVYIAVVISKKSYSNVSQQLVKYKQKGYYTNSSLIEVQQKESYTDLRPSANKNRNEAIFVNPHAQVQRVFTPYEHPFPCFTDEDAGCKWISFNLSMSKCLTY